MSPLRLDRLRSNQIAEHTGINLLLLSHHGIRLSERAQELLHRQGSFDKHVQNFCGTNHIGRVRQFKPNLKLKVAPFLGQQIEC